MIAVVRLYRQHDMDLITLFCNPDIHLCRLMKRALVNYVNGDEVEALSFDEPSVTEGYIPKCVRMHIRLNEGNARENAVIQLLQSMKPGFRCSFIKALFRNSCAYIPMIGYTTGSSFQMRKLKSVPTEAMADADVTAVEETTQPTQAMKPAETPVVSEINVTEEQNVQTTVVNDNASLDDLFDQFNTLS